MIITKIITNFITKIITNLIESIIFRPHTENHLSLDDKDVVGTGRHLLMTIYQPEMSNPLDIDLNETIFNYTAISNTNLL